MSQIIIIFYKAQLSLNDLLTDIILNESDIHIP